MWHSISWFLYVLHYFFGRYTVLAAGSAVLYCIHMQHCTYIICSYSICICCLHILSAVWGLSSLAFFPYSICELEIFHILSPGLLLYIYICIPNIILPKIYHIYIIYIPLIPASIQIQHLLGWCCWIWTGGEGFISISKKSHYPFNPIKCHIPLISYRDVPWLKLDLGA